MVAALFTLVSSCSYDKLEALAICDVEQPTYTTHIKAILDSSCAYAGCHDGAGGIGPGDYTFFGGAQADGPQFRNRVIDLQNMPPSYAINGPTSLTQTELDLIDCWITAGFPE